MNEKLKLLVDRGIVSLTKAKTEKEHIEIFVTGDINDGDYVNAKYNPSIDQFIKDIPLWTQATNSLGRQIENITDRKLRSFLQDISPSSPVDGCEVHSIDSINLKYHDGLGNIYPVILKTPEDARDFIIDKTLEN